jgi:hypothetical protein
MSDTNKSFSFTQGGQTQIHKLRMLKQVIGTTFRISLLSGMLMFLCYYLYGNYYLDVLMYPFWALAEVMEGARSVLSFIKGFSFYIDFDTHVIHRISSHTFLHDNYLRRCIAYLNHRLLYSLIYGGCAFCITFLISLFYFTRKGKTLKQTKQLLGLEVKDLKGYKGSLKSKRRRNPIFLKN